MIELLRADFKRVLKDKLIFIMAILAIVFALVTPLLYAVIFSMAGVIEEDMLGMLINAKGQFFQSFSMGNNMGLIAPVLLAIVLCKDFSYGTVRNKIISGKRRSHVYLSTFIVCSTVLISVFMISAFISLGVSLIFFEYQPTPFTASDFGYFMASLGFELLVLLFMSALLSYLCCCMKNVGIAIVLYVAISLLMVILGSVVQVLYTIMQEMGGQDGLVKFLEVLNSLNVGMYSSIIGMGTSYSLSDVLYLTLTPLVFIVGLLGLGLFGFCKKDLK